MRGPNLSAAAVNSPSLTLFFIIATAIAGLVAFLQLGRSEDPQFTVKAMVVTAVWPGATAEDMQNQVADPLEKRLQELRWFERVETTTRPGLAVMQITLTDDSPPSALADQWYQVRKKLMDEAPRLPAGVRGPFFNDEFSDTFFSLYALSAQGLPDRELVQLAETLRGRLLRVPGVAKVTILGEQPERVFVEIDQARVQSLGIGMAAIGQAIAQANAVTDAGAIETGGPRLSVRLDGAFSSLDDIRNVPVAANGRTLRLGDIATVSRGQADPPAFAIRHGGEPALMLGVVMKPQWNGLALGEALANEGAGIAAVLPLGVDFIQVTNQAAVIDAAYSEFITKFAAALVVVLIVSLVALGFRVGLVVAASVPLTLGAVFVIMLVTDRAFDRITLGALILSLGLLVDDAIIAIEMMVVKMEEGLDRVAAATFAWGATAAPMLSGTLVTIAGFIPIGFAASSSGEYAGNIFWVVAFALIVSWFVAVYFTPWLGVKLLPAVQPAKGGPSGLYDTPRYRRFSGWVKQAVARRRLVVGATIAALVLSAAGMGLVAQQFFPTSDRGELLIDVDLPRGSSFAATEVAARQVEAFVARQDEAGSVSSFIGGGAPRFFVSLNPENPDGSFAKLVVQTADAASRDALRDKVRGAADDGAFPAARVRTSQLLLGPPVQYPVVFRVHGPEISELRRIAEAVRRAMATSPAVRDPHLDHGERVSELRVRFDPARLALLGVTPADAATQVGAALSGQTVSQMRDGNRTVNVLVRASNADRTDAARVGAIVITTPTGARMPVANIGNVEVSAAEPMLRRWNREPFIAVRADTADGVQPPDATAAILPLLDDIRASLPAGYEIRTGGNVEEAAKANVAIAATAPVAIGFMLLFIMVQVRSFKLMALTIATAPLGLIGAVMALLIFRQPFGFVAILGLLGLAGILMRNTLILVDQIQADVAAGIAPYEAIVGSTTRRARPVVLTALAAVLAFIPLTFSTFWGPLAYVLIGGVAVGTLITLFFLPALYALFNGVGSPDPEDSADASATVA